MRRNSIIAGLILLLFVGCGTEPPGDSQGVPEVTVEVAAPVEKKVPVAKKRVKLASTKTATVSDITRVSREQSGSLKALAQSPHAKASHRVLSLRKLETLNHDDAVELSIDLAHNPKTDNEQDARLIRNNAVAALTRAEQRGHKRARRALVDLSEDESMKRLIRGLRQRRDPVQKK